jgi:hypothetical protein
VEEEQVKCKICSRQAVSKDYCSLHETAYRNLTEKFEQWKKALDIPWKDYLNKITENPLTGAKAREVAEALLSEKP